MRVEFDGPAPESLPDGVVVEERASEQLVLRFHRDTIPSGELVGWLSARTSILDLESKGSWPPFIATASTVP